MNVCPPDTVAETAGLSAVSGVCAGAKGWAGCWTCVDTGAGAFCGNNGRAGGCGVPLSSLSAGLGVGSGLGFALKLNGDVVAPVAIGMNWPVDWGPKEKPPLLAGDSKAGFGCGAATAKPSFVALTSTCGGVTWTDGIARAFGAVAGANGLDPESDGFLAVRPAPRPTKGFEAGCELSAMLFGAKPEKGLAAAGFGVFRATDGCGFPGTANEAKGFAEDVEDDIATAAGPAEAGVEKLNGLGSGPNEPVVELEAAGTMA